MQGRAVSMSMSRHQSTQCSSRYWSVRSALGSLVVPLSLLQGNWRSTNLDLAAVGSSSKRPKMGRPTRESFQMLVCLFQVRYCISDLVIPPWEEVSVEAKWLFHEEHTKEHVETFSSWRGFWYFPSPWVWCSVVGTNDWLGVRWALFAWLIDGV